VVRQVVGGLVEACLENRTLSPDRGILTNEQVPGIDAHNKTKNYQTRSKNSFYLKKKQKN